MKLLKYCLGVPLFFALSISAQQTTNNPSTIDISGKVSNEKGETLANANVAIKNGKGTITNAQGLFSLKNVPSNSTLLVSFIGYITQTVPVKGQSKFTFILIPAVNTLDRVVVQAYGITNDRIRTGNIGKVTAEEISKQPIMNPLDALQGQIPGAIVSRINGYASGNIKVEIRGRNTINPNISSDPLYVVDGVPLTILDLKGSENYNNGSQGVIQSGIPSPATGQSPLFSINPSDIESIEVLKDADATAIYGSRGSNGVILITTKKGSSGKSKVEMTFYSGVTSVIRYYPLLNTQQYVEMRKEALINDGIPIDQATAPDLLIWDTSRYTNWQKYLWDRFGKSTDANISLTGGDNRTSFRLSGNFHSQSDILAIKGSNLRGGGSLNLNHKSANKKFLIGLTVSYSLASVNTANNPVAISLPPNAPPAYDQFGNLNFSGWTPLNDLYPFTYLLQEYSAKTNYLNSNLTLTYEILKGLSLKTSIGYSNTQSTQDNKIPIKSQDPLYNPTGTASHGVSLVKNYIVEPQLEYSTFIDRGKLSAFIGSSFQSNNTESSLSNGFFIPNDALLSNIGSAPTQSTDFTTAQYKYIALFGRINYNWTDKYILNINIRRDGSSKFGSGRRFGNFGSMGGAYIFSNSNFIKSHLPFISFGKLRASYGTTGGDQIPNYQYLSSWTFRPQQYNNSQVLNPNRHSDSTLQWQVNRKLEISATLAFFNDKLSLEVSWYRNQCNNQLVAFPTPLITGFNQVYSNSPANVQNTGLEILLQGKPFRTKQFQWTTKLNIGINRNKLLSYPNLSQSPYASQFKIGEPLNLSKVLRVLGVDPNTGLYIFDDPNEDDHVNIKQSLSENDDRYFLDRSVKFDGGFTNSITFRNWSLDLFFYFKKQLGVKALYSIGAFPGQIANQPIEVLNRWQKPGDIATVAAFTTNPTDSYINFQNYSDGIYTDASFIRLQNAVISYNLSDKFLRKLGLTKCVLNLKCQNIFVITKYKGADPEIQTGTQLGNPRIITAGISVNF